MSTAQTLLAVALSLIFLPLGLAKIAAVPFMRQAAAHLGMSPGRYRVIGVLETAGAAGLLLGLAAVPLGVAAAAGLTVLMVAAAVVHLRRGDPPGRALPAAVLALTAVAYAGVAIAVG
ncbi:DoxX family protein [Streptomyces griseorubiginosus]|uniref:DoxX family protein n=1 Tax=Streptomyces griseorubiginosus TaxID=67304 RepID=UPI002E7FB4ED|nr:DoxX family protein [Streptomyces griseorubiginosus]WUB41894.1 DoxX family protein [Streptomyces griseorubiginosus]WUB50414.1 DoxX family protein [Streptomyces griseorubiginosus]